MYLNILRRYRGTTALFALLMIFVAASLSCSHQPHTLSQREPSSLDMPLNFEKEIETKSAEFVANFQKIASPEEKAIIPKVVDAIRLQVARSGIALDLFTRYGKLAAKPVVVVEVVTNFIMAPALLAMGYHAAAAGLVAFPSFMVVGPGTIAWSAFKNDIQLAIELRRFGLFRLQALRKEILGYAPSRHLISEAVDIGVMRSEASIEVVQKISRRFKAGPAISIDELQTIIAKEPEGRAFLDLTYLHKNNPPVYAHELLSYVQSVDSMNDALTAIIKERNVASSSTTARDLLLDIQRLREQMNWVVSETLVDTKESKTWLKSLEMNRADVKVLSKEMEEELTSRLGEVQSLSRRLKRIEFAFLDALQRNPDRSEALIAQTRASLSPVVSDTQSWVRRIPKLRVEFAAFKKLSPSEARELLASNPERCPGLFAILVGAIGF